jgi:hypothetical protein
MNTQTYVSVLTSRPGVLNLFTSTSTKVVVLFASEHGHEMSTESSNYQTVYKYVKKHYAISKEHYWRLKTLG